MLGGIFRCTEGIVILDLTGTAPGAAWSSENTTSKGRAHLISEKDSKLPGLLLVSALLSREMYLHGATRPALGCVSGYQE